jgi:hypothetical protein
MWGLYEEYASEFNSRQPFDAQREASLANQNPAQIEMKTKFVESTKRTDLYVQTVVLQGTGAPNLNFNLPQIQGIPPQVVQQIFQSFLVQLNSQLQPFMSARKIASFGEWRTE